MIAFAPPHFSKERSMIRYLLAAALLCVASEARAQINVWQMNQQIQNQYDQAAYVGYYARPAYYVPPVYYGRPIYGRGYGRAVGSLQLESEVRQLRYAVEDADFARRWGR
jgi:hypothetical protein